MVLGSLLMFWLASGSFVNSEPSSAYETTPAERPQTAVRARPMIAEDYALSVTVRARTEPN